MSPLAGWTFFLLLIVTINQVHGKIIKKYDCTPKPGLNCDLYYMNNADCSSGMLATRFPQIYNNTNLFPNRPYVLNISSYQKEWGTTKKYYPGIKVDIGPPVDASLQDVLGFEVMFMQLTSDVQSCLIFNFSGVLDADEVHNGLTFTGNLWPVAGEKGYFFVAYSLPKPLPQYMDEDSFHYQFLTTGMYGWSNKVPSAHWKSSIIYKNSSATSSIWFSFMEPPDIYEFKVFRVVLMKGVLKGNDLDNETTVDSMEITHFTDTFKHVAPGWYIVKIFPKETKWPDCLCKDSSNHCLHCIATKTVPLLITSTIESTTAAEKDYTSETLTGDDPMTEDKSGMIIAAVLGSVLGIVLLVILLFVYVYRRGKMSQRDTGEIPDNGHLHYYGDDVNEVRGHVKSAYVTTVGNAVPWKIKRIFLVNTEDHAKHLDTLKAFTKFLSTECRCEVLFAPFCTFQDKLRWVINSMDESDFVILVNSTAAFLQYDAWKNNKPAKFCQSLTRAGDIFGPAIQQIASRFMKNQDDHKVLSVQFDYTPDKYIIKDLCMGGQYKIIKHLDEFLCHIHGLRREQSNLEGMGLPSIENLALKQTGLGLLKAIEEADQFEKSEMLQRADSGIDEDTYSSTDTDRSSSSLQNGQENTTEQRPYDYVNVNVNPSSSQQRIYQNSPQMHIEPDRVVRNEYVEVISGDFHPPSSIGDEDIQSRQLRQEILDVNLRYEQNKCAMQDEQSLGGISV